MTVLIWVFWIWNVCLIGDLRRRVVGYDWTGIGDELFLSILLVTNPSVVITFTWRQYREGADGKEILLEFIILSF